MREELYIIDGDNREMLDLSIPSGITLDFTSQMFGDISSVKSSHSYTFSLPKTVRNKQVLQLVNDIRSDGKFFKKKYRCEYFVNGMDISKTANLYVDECGDTYKCVMTFNIILGLQKISEDNFDICELDEKEHVETALVQTVKWGGTWQSPGTPNQVFRLAGFDNNQSYTTPLYASGVAFNSKYNTLAYGGVDCLSSPPVVPAAYILNRISAHFGIGLKWHDHIFTRTREFIKETDEKRNVHLLNLGVVPCVKFGMTENQEKKFSIDMTIPRLLSTHTANDKWLDKPSKSDGYAIWFMNITLNNSGQFVTFRNDNFAGSDWLTETGTKFGFCPFHNAKHPIGFHIEGRVMLWVEYEDFYKAGYKMTFGIYGPDGKLLGSVEGYYRQDKGFRETVYAGKTRNLCCIEFDFRKSITGLSIDVSGSAIYESFKDHATYPYLWFGTSLRVFDREITEDADTFVAITPKQDDTIGGLLDSWQKVEGHAREYQILPTDLISNLPSISCLDFVKSVMHILGAFPKVGDNGDIDLNFYCDLEDNINSGNVYDWSDKIVIGESKISATVEKFAQVNKFIMASDESKESSKDEPQDVYEDGEGILTINNERLEKSNTIVKLPYYAPFISSKENPKAETGNTVKIWSRDIENGFTFKMGEAKPAYGIVKFANDVDKTLIMEVINPFKNIEEHRSLSYLGKILKDARVLSVTANIDIFTLATLDYAKPIFLEQYNSYFAIIDIKWSSNNGLSSLNLIKLPTE